MGILRAAVDKVRKMLGHTPVIDPNISVIDARDWESEITSDPDEWERQVSISCFSMSGCDLGPYKKPYCNKLAVRKNQSQRKNWGKWKGKK